MCGMIEQPENIQSVQEQSKIVNLFEDTGNFHDEKELKKSYDRVPEEEKSNRNYPH